MDSKGEIVSYSWERQSYDTDRSWEAFEVYLQMGAQRSLAKVAAHFGKSNDIIERWSRRDNWQVRVLAWDRHQGRIINERIAAGTAAMRERQVVLAMQLQQRAQKRLLGMKDDEIESMDPRELIALMMAGTEIERRARDIPMDELASPLPDMAPQFNVQIIKPGEGMVSVRLEDGRAGYIPREEVDRFKADHPEAIVII